jgi:hypothetical protein
MSSLRPPDEPTATEVATGGRLVNWKIVATIGIVVALSIAAGVALMQNGSEDEASSPVTDGVPSSAVAPATSSPDGAAPPTSAVGSDDTSVEAPDTRAPIAGPVAPPDERTAAAAIEVLLEETIAAINLKPESTSGSLPDLSQVAIGAVLGELDATRAEFAALGWSQVGTPTIVDLRVVTPPTEQAPADAVVEACLDNSDVRIVDASGRDVRAPGTPPRSLNIYVLRWTEDRWLVADHTFPDDPDC